MVQRQQQDVPYFQFEQLAGHGRIAHAIFTRQGGQSQAPFDTLNLSVSVADDPARVLANRDRAYGVLQRTNQTVVHAHLVHGASVARVTQADNGVYTPHVDGLITNEPGCALTMNFADCAPILLYDPVREAIALGHAGWKGAVADLPGAMVRAMEREFGSRPADLLAGIGPSIGWARYEVDEPLVGQVQAAFTDWQRWLRVPNGGANGRYHFDLPGANRHRLQAAGVTQIEMAGLCTAVRTDLFFSHRAENGKTGRFGVLFVLNKRGR